MGNGLFAADASVGRQQHSSRSSLQQHHHQPNHYQQYASTNQQGYSPEIHSSLTILHHSRTHTSSSVGVPYYSNHYPNDIYVNQTSPQHYYDCSIQNNTHHQPHFPVQQYQPTIQN